MIARTRKAPRRRPAVELRRWLTGQDASSFLAEEQLEFGLSATERPRFRPADDGIRIIDLFCGAGGFTLGFVASGFRPIWANDSDPACVRTYRENFGPHASNDEIRAVLRRRSLALPRADVVIGGPPCQGYSLLNKKREGDPRNELWRSYWRVVQRSEPRAFVIENVPEFFQSPEFEELLGLAAREGFDVDYGVLLAADFGVPQTRKRAFMIGLRDGAPKLPPATHAAPNRARENGLRPWLTVRDAIADLPSPEGVEPRVGIVSPPMDLHFGRNPTRKSLARYRAVPPGGNRFDLHRNRPDITPGCWVRKVSGGTDLFGRLWWERPSVTIRTEFFKPEKGRYLHPDQHRPITHREAARLQTFPDQFFFAGTKVDIARQIGNAVPVLLGRAIAEAVRLVLERESTSRTA